MSKFYEMMKKKRVTFDSHVKIYVLYDTDDLAYNQSRRSDWRQIRADAIRFKRRIKQTEHLISSILLPKHRQKIYTERIRNSLC